VNTTVGPTVSGRNPSPIPNTDTATVRIKTFTATAKATATAPARASRPQETLPPVNPPPDTAAISVPFCSTPDTLCI